MDTLAKNYNVLVGEIVVQMRKEKKDRMEGKEAATTGAQKKEPKSKI